MSHSSAAVVQCKLPCPNCPGPDNCGKTTYKARKDEISKARANRKYAQNAKSLRPSPFDVTDTEIDQFEKDNDAKIYADASTDVYQVGKKDGKPTPKCLERIEITAENMPAIQAMLGLPKEPKVEHFVSEADGYRAQLYKDHRTGKYIVAFRGTEPESQKDWTNNIFNQDENATEKDAPSYFAAAALGGRLAKANPPVNYTGHSKGGGEAFEAMGAGSEDNHATVFNPAAPSPRFRSLDPRTQESVAANTDHYQNSGDFLGTMQGMNGDLTAAKKLEHAEYLRKQLDTGNLKIEYKDSVDRDETRALSEEIKKKSSWYWPDSPEVKNMKQKLKARETSAAKDKADFLAKLDDKIAALRKEAAANPDKTGSLSLFGKPVGQLRQLPVGSPSQDVGVVSLIRHTMDGVGPFDGVNDGLEDAKKQGLGKLTTYNNLAVQRAASHEPSPNSSRPVP